MNNASTLVSRRPDRSLTVSDRLARSLGWFSLGLGLAELVAPGRLARAVGLEGKETLLRGYGAREITAGVGALSMDPGVGMWSRFAGDLVDLGTLATGFKAGDEGQRRNARMAMAVVAGITLMDLILAAALTHERSEARGEKRDYSERSGFPGGAAAAKGAATRNFRTPKEMKADLPQVRADAEPEMA
jgi:hypothetical protein